MVLCAPPGEDDRNCWSNAAQTPYGWASLADFGFTENVRIAADGAPGNP